MQTTTSSYDTAVGTSPRWVIDIDDPAEQESGIDVPVVAGAGAGAAVVIIIVVVVIVVVLNKKAAARKVNYQQHSSVAYGHEVADVHGTRVTSRGRGGYSQG